MGSEETMLNKAIMPKITFGLIVLNGEPFTKFTLRSIYPFAHQIIIVEGANYNSAHQATIDGHSLDNTLETIQHFIDNEDLSSKVTLITAESSGYSDGFWPGEKDEQSQAFATKATGDWLWQVDIDEFYKENDVKQILKLMLETPNLSTITFPELSFWGSFDFVCDGPYLRFQYGKFHRIFKWGKDYRYLTHRPPTVVDEAGIDLRSKNWLNSDEMRKKGIYLYHYCQIFSDQVKRKMKYYSNRVKNDKYPSIKEVDNWYLNTFSEYKDIFHVHTVNSKESWLVKFEGNHPNQIKELLLSNITNDTDYSIRNMLDVERTVQSKLYQFKLITKMIYYNLSYTAVAFNRASRDLLRKRISVKAYVKKVGCILTGKNFPFKALDQQSGKV